MKLACKLKQIFVVDRILSHIVYFRIVYASGQSSGA